MTGGTVLPADISPPPAPGDHDQQDPGQPASTGQPASSSEPGGSGAPGDSRAADRAAATDRAGATDRAVATDRAGAAEHQPAASSELPRIFFADESDQQHKFVGRPYGQPSALGQAPGPGPAGGRGQLPGLGQPAQQRGGPGAVRPRPQRQRPTRPPERELRHRAIASLVLSALSLLALLGLGGDLHRGVYLLIFSAVIGIAGCVIGITAVRKARKSGSYRPRGAIGGIVLGAMAALLSIPILATYLAFPSQVNNYVKCLSQAQSSGAQQNCMDRFYRSIHLGSAGLTGGAARLSGGVPGITSATTRPGKHAPAGPGSGQSGRPA